MSVVLAAMFAVSFSSAVSVLSVSFFWAEESVLFSSSSPLFEASIFSFALAIDSFNTFAKENLADDLVGNLYTMKSVYQAAYAPADWKRRFANYDLHLELENALSAARGNPELNFGYTRLILKDFVYAMRDYHVSISFLSK